MGGFFNLDGPFFKYGNLIADIMIVSALWILTSIPLVTVGASTTALFYVMTRRINEKERYIIKDYFKSFKENFKQSTIIWILTSLLTMTIVFNINSMYNGLLTIGSSNVTRALTIMYVCFLLEIFLIAMYAFPLLSRFEMKTLEIIKTSFFLANKHFPSSVLNVIIIVGIVYCITFFAPIFFFTMGIYASLSSAVFMRIFKKYKPEIDAD